MTQAARVYGGSLYDLAASEQKTEEIREQLAVVRRLFYENPDYLRLLSEPSVPVKERTGLIEEAFGSDADRYLVSFMKLLCERGLIREFGGCCDEFTRKYNIDNNIAEAVVTSAVPLSESQIKALTEKLSAVSGKKVSLSLKTDPRVLAGIRVEIEGKQLDGTVSGRLSGIARRLDDIVL
ncbi:MAG: ATP synthase F1 subunit delta [Blautia sp.]|nr:ATP synthase F1 subunit delta [Blautia sp.]